MPELHCLTRSFAPPVSIAGPVAESCVVVCSRQLPEPSSDSQPLCRPPLLRRRLHQNRPRQLEPGASPGPPESFRVNRKTDVCFLAMFVAAEEGSDLGRVCVSVGADARAS
eukprot:2378103-Rhodomonas_salina.2